MSPASRSGKKAENSLMYKWISHPWWGKLASKSSHRQISLTILGVIASPLGKNGCWSVFISLISCLEVCLFSNFWVIYGLILV